MALTALAVTLAAGTGSARAVTIPVTTNHDSGPGSLRDAVAAAAAGDTVAVPNTIGTITLTSGQITIARDLTVTGTGEGAGAPAISGDHRDRIFHITAGNVTIARLRLVDGLREPGFLGKAGRAFGGAIYDEGSGSLTLRATGFSHNEVRGDANCFLGSGCIHPAGGAVFVNGPLTVSGGNFDHNQAGEGGIDSGEGGGGAIEALGSAGVDHSIFIANVAGHPNDDDFALHTNPDEGFGEGGAIRSVGALTVSTSQFTSNSAGYGTLQNGHGEGGAIYQTGLGDAPLTVSQSEFVRNHAGGAVGFGGAINTVYARIDSSTFAQNGVGGPYLDSSGSAITAFALHLTDSTVTGNSVGRGAGAIWLTDPTTHEPGHFAEASSLIGDTIVDNTAGGSGPAGIRNAQGLTMIATIVADNAAGGLASNCDGHANAALSDLENDAGRQCGFDLTPNEPQLAPLAANGGPTRTRAPQRRLVLTRGPAGWRFVLFSPVIDAITGACGTTVDQRGMPRSDNGDGKCDIGAFETQDSTGGTTPPPPGGDGSPVVTVTAPTPPAGQNGFFNATQLPVDVTVSATDDTAVVSLACTDAIDGAAPVPVAVVAQSGDHPRSGHVQLSAGGTHVLTCVATDSDTPVPHTGAGPGSANTVTVHIDATRPTIHGPAGGVLTVDKGQAGYVASYGVTADDPDGGDRPVVACTPSAPHTFPHGNTTVTCIATDRAGNTASTAFTVAVP